MFHCVRRALLFLLSEAKLRKFIGSNKNVNTLFFKRTLHRRRQQAKIRKFTFTQ